MSAYDPETLNIMRDALDQAWALLPESSKNKHLKIDMATAYSAGRPWADAIRHDFASPHWRVWALIDWQSGRDAAECALIPLDSINP